MAELPRADASDGNPVWRYYDAVALSLYPMPSYGGSRRRARGLHAAPQRAKRPPAPRRRAGPQADLGHRDQLRPAERQQGRDRGAAPISDRPAGRQRRAHLPAQAANGVKRVFWYRYDMRPAPPAAARSATPCSPTRTTPTQVTAAGRRVRAGPGLDARTSASATRHGDRAPGLPRHLRMRRHRRDGHPADLLEPLPRRPRCRLAQARPHQQSSRVRSPAVTGGSTLTVDYRPVMVTADRAGHTPIGCQTVLVSRKAVSRSRPGVRGPVRLGGRGTAYPLEVVGRRDLERASPARRRRRPVRSIALTSMWEASDGAVSASVPVRRLTTPPGTSEVASTSASVIAGSGPLGRGGDDRGVAGDDHRRDHADQAEQAESGGASTATTPVGSGVERLKYGPGDRVGAADHLGELVGPAGVPDQRSIAASTDLPAAAAVPPSPCADGRRRTAPAGPPSPRRPGRAPGRGCTPSRPDQPRERLAGGDHGVAGVLAGGQRRVGQEAALARRRTT